MRMLINQVVPPVDLLPAARAMARGLTQSIAGGLLVEGEQFARVAPTADLREGLDAWLAKRPPVDTGNWRVTARATTPDSATTP